MAKESKIEWTEATWNPWYGCHKVSQGCKNCYMYRDIPRFGKDPNTVVRSKTTFSDPLKWREPRRIFTCSWSDFFIEEADPWRDEAFAIMALTPHHTYQVLTKRPDRMRDYLTDPRVKQDIHDAAHYGDNPQLEKRSHEIYTHIEYRKNWPLPNVWLGVSVEDQKTADERIPLLLQTPAALRWLSIEPLLGPLDLTRLHGGINVKNSVDVVLNALSGQYWPAFAGRRTNPCIYDPKTNLVEWIVAGGESGPDARPMHPDWLRSIRDQCTAANVPFFFKQWGEWAPAPDWDGEVRNCENLIQKGSEGSVVTPTNKFEYLRRVGKKAAGRILDGRTWDEMPEVSR